MRGLSLKGSAGFDQADGQRRMIIMNRFQLSSEEYELIREFRHDLHMNPELSGAEFRTTEKIKSFVGSLQGFKILDLPVKTGVVARLSGNKPGEIMLRCDIDALPQTEETDISWKSRVSGVMHACGHDLHTASLCGAALLLNRTLQSGEKIPTVDLVFQPAEEGTTGARNMIDAGLFDLIHPDACFGFHNWPSIDTGKAVCREGALMAAKRNFDITVFGSGGHGSMPHLNRDPIVCAAAIVQSLQTIISRNVNPLDSAILSINMIEGGSQMNIVADQVRMKGTIRSLSKEALDRAIGRVKMIVLKTAEAYECKSDVRWKERFPAVWNPAGMVEAAEMCAEAAGCEIVEAPPSLASEDFSLYGQYVPSFFFWLGSRVPGARTNELHTPGFYADDEALVYGAQLFAACACFAGIKPPEGAPMSLSS